MAAIENIIAWAKLEQARLTGRLAELQSGRLRTYEKHAHSPGWLEVDTTEHTIELCRHYLSELSAIMALHPAIVPTQPAAPPPEPRFIPPQPQLAPQPEAHPRHPEMHGHLQQAVHADWVVGWGVVKGSRRAGFLPGSTRPMPRPRRPRPRRARGITRAGAATTSAARSLPAGRNSPAPTRCRGPALKDPERQPGYRRDDQQRDDQRADIGPDSP